MNTAKIRASLALLIVAACGVGCTQAAVENSNSTARDAARLENRELRKPLPERVPDESPVVAGEAPDSVIQRAIAALECRGAAA